MSNDDDRPLTRREAAQWLQEHGYPIQAATLAKRATIGGGPQYVKFGRRPLYSKQDLLTWARSRTTRPVRSSSNSP